MSSNVPRRVVGSGRGSRCTASTGLVACIDFDEGAAAAVDMTEAGLPTVEKAASEVGEIILQAFHRLVNERLNRERDA